MMDVSKLAGVLPSDIFAELQTVLSTRVISKYQLCHLLANCDHETGGWTRYEENLNYRAERLLQVFPKYFKSLSDAQQVVSGGKVAIADRIYGGRMGNVRGTDDGYKFRGSGALQLTGRNNFVAFDATVPDDVTNNPELARTKYKLTTAFWFFDVNKIWVKAVGNDAKAITQVRKAINGGTNGLSEVIRLFGKYAALIN